MHDPYCIYGMNSSLVNFINMCTKIFHFEKALITNYLQGCDLTKKEGVPLILSKEEKKLNFKYKHYNNI